MKICHLIASLDVRWGGLPKSAASLSAALAARGHEVVLMHGGPAERDLSLPGIDRVRLASAHAAGVITGLRRIHPAVLHVHGLWEPMLALAQRWAFRRGIPVILMPHSMLHPWQCGRRRMAKALVRKGLGYERMWGRAARVQVLSDSEADHWARIAPGRCRVIPNGIFPEEDPGDSGQPLPGVGASPFVLSLARMHPQKAPEVLLDGFARLAAERPDLQLVMAGPDYGSEPALRRRAAALGLSTRVWFPGLLRGAAKWDALHRCRVFALPSRAEGFSMAVLEAALAGAPAVISGACAFDRLVEAGGAVRVAVTPESVAEGLRRVLARSREEMGACGRELVRSDYTWDRLAAEVERMYREVG